MARKRPLVGLSACRVGLLWQRSMFFSYPYPSTWQSPSHAAAISARSEKRGSSTVSYLDRRRSSVSTKRFPVNELTPHTPLLAAVYCNRRSRRQLQPLPSSWRKVAAMEDADIVIIGAGRSFKALQAASNQW